MRYAPWSCATVERKATIIKPPKCRCCIAVVTIDVIHDLLPREKKDLDALEC